MNKGMTRILSYFVYIKQETNSFKLYYFQLSFPVLAL